MATTDTALGVDSGSHRLDALQITRELVRRDSQNPGPGECEVADFVIHEIARPAGFDVEVIEPTEGRPNLLLTVDRGAGRHLVLSGHLDTKPVGDAFDQWHSDPLELSIRDGLAYGLGTSDMKGPIAAMLVALEHCSRTPGVGRASVLLTADEEVASAAGAAALAHLGIPSCDALVIGEPSGDTRPWESIAIVSRGIACFEIHVTTQQGHSGLSPRLGRSAVQLAAEILLAFDRWSPPVDSPGPIDCEPTVNPGVLIEGGIAYGTWPGRAALGCEIRLVPGMDRQSVYSSVADLARSVVGDRGQVEVRAVDDSRAWSDAVATGPESLVVRAAQAACRDVLGMSPPLGAYPGTTEAAHFGPGLGVPVIASLGPGWLSVAHGPNECIAVEDLHAGAAIYTALFEHFLADGPEGDPHLATGQARAYSMQHRSHITQRRTMYPREVVNAKGPATVLGGAQVDDRIIEAMADAMRHSVHMGELQWASGQEIAKAIGAEAAFVTNCASAGMAIAVAAAIAGDDLAQVTAMPLASHDRTEVVVQKAHMIIVGGCDAAQVIRMGGGVPVEVGTAADCVDFHLRAGLSERTAIALFVDGERAHGSGTLDLRTFAQQCHAAGVPVVVDAAGTTDPGRFLAEGADLVVFSAQKWFRGPTAGVIAGRKDLIHAAFLEGEFGVGRPMKAGKEDVAGTLAAVRIWAEGRDESRAIRERAIAQEIVDGLADAPGLKVRHAPTEHESTAAVSVRIDVDPAAAKVQAWQLAAYTEALDPSVALYDYEAAQGYLLVDPGFLHDGDGAAIVEAVRAGLAAAAATPVDLAASPPPRFAVLTATMASWSKS